MRGAVYIGMLISVAIAGYLHKKQAESIPNTITNVLPVAPGEKAPKDITEVKAHVEKEMNRKMEKRYENISNESGNASDGE